MTEISEVPEDLTQPDGMFGKILREFGLQWTNIAVLSGVLFSTFGLEKYMNSGVWTISAVTSFCVAYFFRRQITGEFPRVAMLSGLAALLLLGGPLLYYLHRGADIGDLIAGHRNLSTTYLACSLVIPLAVAIVAYRRQEQELGGSVPVVIRQALNAAVISAAFYRENQIYMVTVASMGDGKVTLRTALTYTVRNRRKDPQQWYGSFVSPAAETRYVRVAIDGREIDVTDPDYLSPRGLRVSRTIQGRSGLKVEFEAEEDFRASDSELFTAYAPTDSLALMVENPYADSLRFHFETLYPVKADPETDGQIVSCRIDTGLLPFQGFRLHWSPIT
ncbi:hypothetical protein OG552_13920 [Streptomyces sp. NBC_01476]|uniref:hypothetical protein n=1 Tax=Streptomyces sp. NBC_01476 TaxID=2903881 RepID=UPI002E31AD1E|nr:hypothetical protein [Streptomyces sp. NBC_01476]